MAPPPLKEIARRDQIFTVYRYLGPPRSYKKLPIAVLENSTSWAQEPSTFSRSGIRGKSGFAVFALFATMG